MASFDKITIEVFKFLGFPLEIEAVGNTQTIFDTGTTQIVGDPKGIEQFYNLLKPYGAKSAPQYGDGIYTSTSASSFANQMSYDILLYHSPLQLQHSHLCLCRREESQYFSRII
jgi:hypothetical protein